MRLQDKVCIVTGAAQGIGLATALKFAREGAIVAVCHRRAEVCIADVTDRVAVDAMVGQGSGAILNASSVVGIYGNHGQTNHAASKFGVIGFTKTWSRELGPKGVRVNGAVIEVSGGMTV